MDYTLIADIAAEVEIPVDGTLSRVLYRDDRVRVVGFAFDTGQELTEHTAGVPVLIQVVSGRMRVTLGGDEHEIHPATWLRMDEHLAHSVVALEPSVMLLTLFKGGDAS